jgi:hypothetical protein
MFINIHTYLNLFVYRLDIIFKELDPKSFLRFGMRITSFPYGLKNHTREFQIISNYTKLIVVCAINFLLKKNRKSNVSWNEVVNPGGYKYSSRNLEMGEH